MGVMYRVPITYEEILHEDYHEGDGEACRAFNPHSNPSVIFLSCWRGTRLYNPFILTHGNDVLGIK